MTRLMRKIPDYGSYFKLDKLFQIIQKNQNALHCLSKIYSTQLKTTVKEVTHTKLSVSTNISCKLHILMLTLNNAELHCASAVAITLTHCLSYMFKGVCEMKERKNHNKI